MLRRIRTAFFRWSLIPLTLSLLAGALVGAGAFAVHYGNGTSYLSNDPQSCVNCHIMRDHYDGWQASSHHAVAVCNDCHAPHDFTGKYLTKVENGFWHSLVFTTETAKDPLVIRERNSRVLQGSCIHCHRGLVEHILDGPHEIGTEATSCIRCHASVGHGPVK